MVFVLGSPDFGNLLILEACCNVSSHVETDTTLSYRESPRVRGVLDFLDRGGSGHCYPLGCKGGLGFRV